MKELPVCGHCGLPHQPSTTCPIAHLLDGQRSPQVLAPGACPGSRFRVLTVLHQHDRSTVYQAQDLRAQGAPVVLKEYNTADLPAEERAESLRWLTREAGLLSTLTHPQLPRLLAAFSEGDRHFIAMPFIEGCTMDALVRRRGPLPETMVLNWAQSITGLLDYLHTQDPPIIHRDIKPANMLVQPDGEVLLLDLGVARPAPSPEAGTAIGTPGYASPEQYQGLADQRSDLYALGASLHQMLTGYDAEREPPFRQPPVRALNPAVSSETAAVVDHLLQLAPEQRFAQARQVGGVIGDILNRVSTRPLLRMYQQVIVLLVAGVLFSAGFYRWAIVNAALPLHIDPTSATFVQDSFAARLNPSLVYLHLGREAALQLIFLVFAPALLCFVPLFQPRVQALLRRDPALRSFWWQTLLLLAVCWGFPFAVWAADLALVPSFGPDWVLQPGALVLSVPVALGSALVALLLLGCQMRAPRHLQVYGWRLCWQDLFVQASSLVLFWSVILIVQQLAIHSG
jgi:tRNA A-37 threonylcarbamoyl transferase component Bud32